MTQDDILERKMRMEKELERWVMYQANAELDRDDTLRRKDVIRNVLMQYARSGHAERFNGRDGHIAWRATREFRDWLDEGQLEYNGSADVDV